MTNEVRWNVLQGYKGIMVKMMREGVTMVRMYKDEDDEQATDCDHLLLFKYPLCCCSQEQKLPIDQVRLPQLLRQIDVDQVVRVEVVDDHRPTRPRVQVDQR